MKNKEKGFTIIELIIILFAIGVFLAFAQPNFYKFLNKSQRQKIQNDSMILKSSLDLDIHKSSTFLEEHFSLVDYQGLEEIYLNGKLLAEGDFPQENCYLIDQEYRDLKLDNNMKGDFCSLEGGPVIYSQKGFNVLDADKGNIIYLNGNTNIKSILENPKEKNLTLIIEDSFGENDSLTGFSYNGALQGINSDQLSLKIISNNSEVKEARYFLAKSNIKNLDFSQFNTEGLKDATSMFQEYQGEYLDLGSLRLPRVSNLHGMFQDSESLKTIYLRDISSPYLVNIQQMFSGCSSLENLYINLRGSKNLATMELMFLNCSSLKELDLYGWDTENLKNMKGAFFNCESLETIDLSQWKLDEDINMENAFYGCNSLKTIKVKNVDEASRQILLKALPSTARIVGDEIRVR